MIEITDLDKRFGTTPVLRDIDVTIQRGRITALVGPNGAGKTTLIKCILGLTRATKGTIRVGDVIVDDNPAYRADIGYMPQIARFPENLTADDLIALVTDLRNASDQSHASLHLDDLHDDELLDQFQLRSELSKPLRVLSGGTRQKVNAVLAFLFQPDLVILDEPSAGLDPIASSIVKDKIRRARTRGCTVLLTSHIMGEVEELAEDVVCLLNGEVGYAGSAAYLKHSTRQPTLERAIAHIMVQGSMQ